MSDDKTITLSDVVYLLEALGEQQHKLFCAAVERCDLHEAAKHDAIGDGVILALVTLREWIASHE